MISYDQVKFLYDKYVEDCFCKCSSDHTKELLEIINHTNRVINYCEQIAAQNFMNLYFIELLKTCALLHDIGKLEMLGHKEYNLETEFAGANFLQKEGFKRFEIPLAFQSIIWDVILYHPMDSIENQNFYSYDCKKSMFEAPADSLNDYSGVEKLKTSLTQLLKDANNLDELYQRAKGIIKSPDDTIEVNNIGLIDLISRWGVTSEILYSHNKSEVLKQGTGKVILPISAINIRYLEFPYSLKLRIYHNEDISLKNIQNESYYTDITEIWIRIYMILKNIYFTQTLKIINEQDLLNQIYNQYPQSLRPLIKEIIVYAKEKLVNEKITLSKGNIYTISRKRALFN